MAAWGGAMLLAAALPALAQDEMGVTLERRESFWDTVRRGAELPGVIIGMMSVAAVAFIVEHFISIRRTTMLPADELSRTRTMIEGRRWRECYEQLRGSRTMFAHLMSAGMQHGKHGFDAMHEAVDKTAAAWSSRLFRRVEYLNILGNLGPLMGLLGTVLGMIDAFSQMHASHGAYKTEDLSRGISLALVNTFLGLGLAIVALGFFGVCRNRVDRWTVEAHAAAIDLLEYFRPGAAPAPSQPAGAATPNVAAAPRVARPERTAST